MVKFLRDMKCHKVLLAVGIQVSLIFLPHELFIIQDMYLVTWVTS
jgi:hypothetical protein